MGSNCYKQGYMFANATPKSFSLDNVIQPKQSVLSNSPLKEAMNDTGYSTEMENNQESTDFSGGKDSCGDNEFSF